MYSGMEADKYIFSLYVGFFFPLDNMSVVNFCCPVAWVVVRTKTPISWLTLHYMGSMFCGLVFLSSFRWFTNTSAMMILDRTSAAKTSPFCMKKILFLSSESLFLGQYWKSDRTCSFVPRWQSSPNKVFENLNNLHLVKNCQDVFKAFL